MRLVLLNGPPGSGKSTLARRYADNHPPALALDVDWIRAMIGGWRTSPGEAGLLAGCYRMAFQLAIDAKCRTIAFPAISCGVYSYPIEEAAKIALGETLVFLDEHPAFVRVVFVLFDHPAMSIYQRVFEGLVLQRTRSAS